jgi:biotin carboxyl carrier protein
MKKLRVTVEGKVYDVLVEMLDEGTPAATPHAAAPVAPLAPVASTATPAAPSGPPGSGNIASPLAGKVVSLDVKVGQSVAEGAQVATIEAMKMNTYLYAPKAGTVAAILVHPGDGVEEGTVMIRLG